MHFIVQRLADREPLGDHPLRMREPEQSIRHVVGVMTGTSIDGIDAALVRIEGRGLALGCTLIRHVSESLGSLQARLRAAADQQPMTAGEFATLAWDFGALHADVIERLLTHEVARSIPPSLEAGGKGVGEASQSGLTFAFGAGHHPPPGLLPQGRGERFDLICIHGQTVFHQPPISWQLVNPAPIAARFACPIISDLRQADLAHGGQGAPITPLADWILFRNAAASRAIVNLGGFCNVTIIPSQRAGASSPPSDDSLRGIRGFDVCACNQVLDAIAREVLKKPFDADGAAASRGHASPHAAEALRAILERQRRGGRSLGTGDDAAAWIREHRAAVAPHDLAASAVQAIGHTIIAAINEHGADELILAGGGARNRALHAALQAAGGRMPVGLTDELGVPIDAREAMCFAVLGAMCQDVVPITLQQVTGCRESGGPPISGMRTNHARSRRV